MNRRSLLAVAYAATLGLGLVAVEQQWPGGLWTVLQVVALIAAKLLLSGWFAVLVIAACVALGYAAAVIRHGAAIGAAHVERRHERRIDVLRKRESTLLAQLRGWK